MQMGHVRCDTVMQVHRRFYGESASSSGVQDVREHLQALRREVLSGCRLTFSRIIPRGDPHPQSHRLWQLAEQVDSSTPSTTTNLQRQLNTSVLVKVWRSEPSQHFTAHTAAEHMRLAHDSQKQYPTAKLHIVAATLQCRCCDRAGS